jgi:hypothetical protein
MTNLGSETYSTYVDIDEDVKSWLQFNGLSTERDQALQLITDAVCTEAARYLGRPIAPTTFGPADGVGKFDGAGGLNSGYIMLPRTPVIAVESVIEYQGDNPVELFEVDTVPPPADSDGYHIEYRTGRLTRVLGRVWNRPFFPGADNVWVTWTAGYNPIPADIRWATLEWIAHVFRNTQQSARYQMSAAGDDAEMIASGLWTGVPNRITAALASYVKIGIR